MNYKKYLLIFLSIFILIACKKLPENNTRNNYQKVKAMKENTFREKVAKYLAYAKILNDDKDLRATVLAERNRMEAKIEKTMDYRIIGGNDELLNIMIAENYRGYIEHNPFTKTKDNPDTILEITAKLVEYSPNKIEEKKEQNDFEEIYIDENGKEATNKVKYVKTHFFKSSYAKVEVKYKLISILTGEAYREYIRRVCVGGIDKRQINLNHVEDFPIIVPPLDLQNRFAEYVSSIDKSKLAVKKSLEELEILKKSLMQKYFA